MQLLKKKSLAFVAPKTVADTSSFLSHLSHFFLILRLRKENKHSGTFIDDIKDPWKNPGL